DRGAGGQSARRRPVRFPRRRDRIPTTGGGPPVRVLHFDCFSGVSGDMTLAALLDAGVEAAAVRRGLDSLGLPIAIEVEKVRKGGFAATAVRIEAPEEHAHRHLPEVEEILGKGSLTQRQRELALAIFRRL